MSRCTSPEAGPKLVRSKYSGKILGLEETKGETGANQLIHGLEGHGQEEEFYFKRIQSHHKGLSR